MEIQYAKRTYSTSRIWGKLISHIAMQMPFLKGEWRARLHKIARVNIINPKRTFIGDNVFFDDLHPENITIEEGCIITSGCKIITHFIDPTWNDYNHMRIGKVYISKNVFIGLNVLIINSICIGEGAIIGAGAVITKDIPPYTIWSGNPAKQIKSRKIINIA